MSKPTESEFLARYESDHVVQRLAKDLYRAMYPSGMNTNGPLLVTVNGSMLQNLLARHAKVKS